MPDPFKPSQQQVEIMNESAGMIARAQETAALYHLSPEESLREITDTLLAHPNTKEAVKTAITTKGHRYFVFRYPSGSLSIKGYISLPKDTATPLPLIILLRGGNRLFGLPHPGIISAQTGISVVSTTYRGGVSEGEDEYGGNDVIDVKNLIAFLPQLEQKLQLQFHPHNRSMVGLSRGGMQMFLALGQYPELQQGLKKIASISGLLNMAYAIKDRPDFKSLLKDFGYTEDEQGKAWIAKRQPLNMVGSLSKTLPILIAQGTADTRVCLEEGLDMLKALKEAGCDVTYLELEGGNHTLTNKPEFVPTLIKWLMNE